MGSSPTWGVCFLVIALPLGSISFWALAFLCRLGHQPTNPPTTCTVWSLLHLLHSITTSRAGVLPNIFPLPAKFTSEMGIKSLAHPTNGCQSNIPSHPIAPSPSVPWHCPLSSNSMYDPNHANPAVMNIRVVGSCIVQGRVECRQSSCTTKRHMCRVNQSTLTSALWPPSQPQISPASWCAGCWPREEGSRVA